MSSGSLAHDDVRRSIVQWKPVEGSMGLDHPPVPLYLQTGDHLLHGLDAVVQARVTGTPEAQVARRARAAASCRSAAPMLSRSWSGWTPPRRPPGTGTRPTERCHRHRIRSAGQEATPSPSPHPQTVRSRPSPTAHDARQPRHEVRTVPPTSTLRLHGSLDQAARLIAGVRTSVGGQRMRRLIDTARAGIALINARKVEVWFGIGKR
jgi:hypothetical protein